MIKKAEGAIRNPALPEFNSPTQGGAGLAFYISQLWKTLVIVGGIAFLLYTILGGLSWITAAGDAKKIDIAQKQITNGLIGLIILVGSYAIMAFIQNALQIDFLNIDWTFGN